MKIEDNVKKIKVFEVLLSIIFTIITFFSTDNINGYGILVVIPLLYTVCCIVSTKIYIKSFTNIAILTIHIIAFIKYAVMPMVIAINNDYYGGVLTAHIPSNQYIEHAIMLICYELLSVFSVIAIINNKKDNKYALIEQDYDNERKLYLKPIISVVLLVGLIILLFFGKYLVPKSFFIISKSYTAIKMNFKYDGLIKILYDIFKLIVYLLLLDNVFYKYKETSKYKYLVFSGIILVLYLGISMGTSRWSLLIPALIYVMMIYQRFDVKVKPIIVLVGIVLMISIISITIYKFSWLINDNEQLISNIFRVLTQQVQEYFSGPRAVAQGIQTVDIYKSEMTWSTFFNDYLGSIPLLSHYIDQKDRSNIYYNYLLKGRNASPTQIMPMNTIGMAYFGEIGSIILIVCNLIVAINMGQKLKNSRRTRNIFYEYIYSYAAIWFSMSLMFNTQIVFGWYITTYIPFLIIIMLNDMIGVKGIKNNGD